jgi:hypothetical protein
MKYIGILHESLLLQNGNPATQLFCGIPDSVNNTPHDSNQLNYSFLYKTITTKIPDWKADVTDNSKLHVTGDNNQYLY